MKKTLSLVIPVYNEQSRIAGCLTALKYWKSPRTVKVEQIIFVNDGSTDRTKTIIQKAKKSVETKCKANVTIISYPQNRGKGYAIAQGMQASTSDYTLFLDADMSTPLTELTKLLPAMRRGIHVIVGTRKNGKSTVVVHQPIYRELLGRAFTRLSNVVLNTWVTDFTCGFKVFSKEAKNAIFPLLVSARWGFDAESMFRARTMGYTISEVPVMWTDKKGSKVNVLRDIPGTLYELMIVRMGAIRELLMEKPSVLATVES